MWESDRANWFTQKVDESIRPLIVTFDVVTGCSVARALDSNLVKLAGVKPTASTTETSVCASHAASSSQPSSSSAADPTQLLPLVALGLPAPVASSHGGSAMVRCLQPTVINTDFRQCDCHFDGVQSLWHIGRYRLGSTCESS